MVKAKKHLGQHFLTDENIAEKIVKALSGKGFTYVLEVGPGMGVLTKYLLAKPEHLLLAEIDEESISYLKQTYPTLSEGHFKGAFLKMVFSFLE